MSKKILIGLVLALAAALCLLALKLLGSRPAPVEPTPIVTASARAFVPLQVAEVSYDGKFGAGWEDWGWGPHQVPATPGPLKVEFAGYGGILLHHAELRSGFGGLSFRYKTPAEWGNFITVKLKLAGSAADAFPSVNVQPTQVATLPNGWMEVLLTWSELNPKNLPIDSVSLGARRPLGPGWVELDKIEFVKESASASPLAPPARRVKLAIQCTGASHPISPLIYGASGGDWGSGITAGRIGGNTTTRLNWDLGNTWNTGSDWFFENVRGERGLWDWLDEGSAHHAQIAVTVPIIGWVAKDATSVGFPRRKFGAQRKYDEHRPEAGDGFLPNNTAISPGSPTETSVPAPPELIGRWIGKVRDRDRTRGERTALMYILDNEPSLWNATHRDVHPEPLTYDELLDRSIRYARAIRDADPGATIAGPAEWGWTGYLYSAKDRETGTGAHIDRLAHGNVALIPWYLQQLARYENANHKRLLDVLDVHFYPAAVGVYGANARTDAEGSELRLRSTRALWDPTYRDESWIGEPVALIPLLKDWVAKNYPGLKISIGEWSFGADDHISGALATVEALGRFGQQGLDFAFYWGGPRTGSKTFQAFRAYRNFDGAGGHFLDLSVPTREDEKVSLFASRDVEKDRIVAIVLNRDSVFDVDASVALEGCGTILSRRSFSYGPKSDALSEQKLPASDGTQIEVSLLPYSFTVLDLALRPPSALP